MSDRYEIEGAEAIHHLIQHDEEQSLFPIFTPEIVQTISNLGFGKLGFAFGVEDPLGRILTYPHKPSEKDAVADGQWSVPSETVAGQFNKGELVRVETFEQCLTRCLLDEQGVDLREAPDNARLFVKRQMPLLYIDWQMDEDGSTPNTFAVSLSLSANQAMAEHIALSGRPTKEAHQGFFQSIGFLERQCVARNIRTTFDLWLARYVTTSELVPGNLTRPIDIPEVIAERGEWQSLRFNQVCRSIGNLAVASFVE